MIRRKPQNIDSFSQNACRHINCAQVFCPVFLCLLWYLHYFET